VAKTVPSDATNDVIVDAPATEGTAAYLVQMAASSTDRNKVPSVANASQPCHCPLGLKAKALLDRSPGAKACAEENAVGRDSTSHEDQE
jgi:hypothetical protein